MYAFLYMHPLSLDELEYWGLFISGLRPEPWVVEWEALGTGFGSFNPQAFFSQPCMSVLVSYAVLSTLAFTFYTVGFQDIAKDPTIELAKDLPGPWDLCRNSVVNSVANSVGIGKTIRGGGIVRKSGLSGRRMSPSRLLRVSPSHMPLRYGW